MKKKQNRNWAGNMDVDAWRERQIAKRLKAHLEESERRFAAEHAADTDEAMRSFVRRKARALGRMPHPLELEGGLYLQRRLGDWGLLAIRLGFRPPAPELGTLVAQRLWEEEAEHFAAERRARKKEKRKRFREKQEKRVSSSE